MDFLKTELDTVGLSDQPDVGGPSRRWQKAFEVR